MEVEGSSVLEQLSRPSELLHRRVAFLLSHVKGEYEDEDGDWATEFIVADPVPSSNSNCWNRQKYSKDAFISEFNRNGSADEFRLPSTSPDSSMDHEGSCSNNDSVPAPNDLSIDRNSTELRNKLSSVDHFMNVVDGGELMPGGECSNRKRQLESADRSYESSESEDGIFCCGACGKTLPLTCVCQMLSCDCLLCISCCRLHVESSLLNATRRAGHNGDLGTRRRRPAKVADPASDDDGTTKPNPRKDTVISQEELGLYVDLFPEESNSCLDSISCPTPSCGGRLQLSEAQSLAPEAFGKWEEAASQDLMKQCTSYVNCPGCDIVIEKVASELPPGIALSGVPEFDRTVPFIELDQEGKQLSRSALCHRAANRFRCSLCLVDFCGQCMNVPYHLGKTCEEFEEQKNALKCIYCEDLIRSFRHDEKFLSSCSVRELRKELVRADVDALWCMEKRELVAVQRFASSVCSSKECRKHLQLACTRTLECGHHCGGVRGERLCMPCLEDGCREKAAFQSPRNHLPSADDLCSICMVEVLRQAPSIQLKCGHIVHMHCARRKLEEGCPGPGISFAYLNCPQCPELMEHSGLNWYMKKPLALLEQVQEKALRRLKMEGLFETSKELKSGGRFEGKPSEFALQLYRYYICCKCNTPYFGGQRDCAANDGDDNANRHNPLDLVCGGCSAASCGPGLCQKGHGKEFVEFKCKFCCSIATYFCFGQTHFCESCHTTRPDMHTDVAPVQCKGEKWCPLHIAHTPNGQEFCLGCSMCRLSGQ